MQRTIISYDHTRALFGCPVLFAVSFASVNRSLSDDKVAPMLRRLHDLDVRLYRKVTAAHNAHLDNLLLPLSKVANRSMLWMAIAALLGSLGGRFQRRAALRGLVSVAFTSALANLPLKMIARRKRPAIKLLPKPRRLTRFPTSFSFPSGHAASAAAFATGASLESPYLGPPLGALAGAVAYSRIYLGVHYPADVAAGGAIGVAVGLLTRRWWPLASRAAIQGPRLTAVGTKPRPTGSGLTIVVNPEAGPVLSKNPVDGLRSALPEAEIVEVEAADDFAKSLEAACRRSEVVGVSGGDGSINAGAKFAAEFDKPLMVVPAGTLNHLARDLGLSSAAQAIDAVRRGHTVALDTGVIDGRIFLNTASFGGYADIVDAREKLESKIGKWPALFVALLKVLRTSTPVEAQINGHQRKLWMIFIGNCCYEPKGLLPNFRQSMDDGLLDVRLIDASRRWARTRLLLAVVSGRANKTKVLEQFAAKSLEVKSLQGPLRLARDGETFDGSSEFKISKTHKPLLVFAPLKKAAPV